MKVKVDENTCIGCGSCVSICPDVFDFNDDGISKVKVDKIDDKNKSEVEDAIASCPVGAISKED